MYPGVLETEVGSIADGLRQDANTTGFSGAGASGSAGDIKDTDSSSTPIVSFGTPDSSDSLSGGSDEHTWPGTQPSLSDFARMRQNSSGQVSDKELENLGLALIRERLARSGSSAASGVRSPCDPIYTHPVSGASVYCGGWSAADNLDVLGSKNIRRVVNCQDPSSQNFFQSKKILRSPHLADNGQEGDPQKWVDQAKATPSEKQSAQEIFNIAYCRFHINGIDRECGRFVSDTTSAGDPASAKQYTQKERKTYEEYLKYWRFLDEGLEKGESGLIHCAAGMHRAGGASVAYLMWKHRLDYEQGLKLAKSKRSVINPYHRNSIKIVEKILRAETPEEEFGNDV